MVGSAIIRRLRQDSINIIITASRDELDLINQQAVNQFFADNKYIVKVISIECDNLVDSVELMIHQQNFIKLDNHYVENVRQNKKTYELELVGRNPDILVDIEYRRVHWEHFYINREFIRI